MKELCEGCECEKIEQMIRHTVWSSGRNKIIIGLSGGIDSALAAVLCTRAVGAENVLGYMLPSAVTPKEDIDDVKALCEKFGIKLAIVPITGLIGEFSKIDGFTENNYLLGNVILRSFTIPSSWAVRNADAEPRLSTSETEEIEETEEPGDPEETEDPA